MKTEDETMYNEQQENDGTMINSSEKENDVVYENTSGTDWKQVIMGGAVGIFFGTIGMAFTSATTKPQAVEPEEKEEENGEQESVTTAEVPTTHVTVDSLPVASSVSDDMSFSEAFAAARAEVGAGGVFAWHGGVYGTYYATEWNSMTPEEQAEFGSKVHYGSTQSNLSHHQTQTTVSHEESGNTHTAETSHEETDSPQRQTAHVTQQGNGQTSDSEVRILGVEHVSTDEGEVVVANAEIGGRSAIFIDLDNDNVVDAAGIDMDNDGQITLAEMSNVEDQNLQMSQLQQMADSQNYMASVENNGPDYINDANVGGYEA